MELRNSDRYRCAVKGLLEHLDGVRQPPAIEYLAYQPHTTCRPYSHVMPQAIAMLVYSGHRRLAGANRRSAQSTWANTGISSALRNASGISSEIRIPLDASHRLHWQPPASYRAGNHATRQSASAGIPGWQCSFPRPPDHRQTEPSEYRRVLELASMCPASGQLPGDELVIGIEKDQIRPIGSHRCHDYVRREPRVGLVHMERKRCGYCLM